MIYDVHFALVVPYDLEVIADVVHDVFAVEFQVPGEDDFAFFLACNDAHFIRVHAHSDLLDLSRRVFLVHLELYFLFITVREVIIEA